MKGEFMFYIISSSLSLLNFQGHPVILLADDIENPFNICVSYM